LSLGLRALNQQPGIQLTCHYPPIDAEGFLDTIEDLAPYSYR
jgi:hypothetical protein